MSLLTRLTVPLEGEEKIPSHQFVAVIKEFERGAPGVNANSIAAAFNLSASEKSALIAWYSSQFATGAVSRELLHDALLLGESELYTISQVESRLGL